MHLECNSISSAVARGTFDFVIAGLLALIYRKRFAKQFALFLFDISLSWV